MPRDMLERELQTLQDELLTLGSIVERTIVEAVDVLRRRDHARARRLIAHDRQINERRFAIEAQALALIATQQPMARDLRIIAAVLEIVTELERIGDYAKGIARISLMLGEGPLVKPLVDLPEMAARAATMLHQALDAFVRQDPELARAITEQDDEVDARYNQVYRELMTHILASPDQIDQANYLLWVAHNLERSADRVTNICERVVFMATGRMVELDVEDSERLESLPA